MRRLTMAVGLVVACGIGWALGSMQPATDVMNDSAGPRLSHELDEGRFGIFSDDNAHPVAHVWVRTENGVAKETWVMLRPGSTDGWTFPGSDATDETWNVKYLGSGSHANDGAFVQWCEAEYDSDYPALNVDAGSDFEIHVHSVTIL